MKPFSHDKCGRGKKLEQIFQKWGKILVRFAACGYVHGQGGDEGNRE